MLSVDLMNNTYMKKLLFKYAMIFLIVGGINWLLVGLFDLNLVTSVFGDGVISTIIYIIVGLSAIAIMFDRNTYLPFLGPMVAPCSVLQNRVPPGATREVNVVVKPYSKVLYWASEPSTANLEKINSWKQAYLNYDNAGVVTSDANGKAILKIREPQAYRVPIRGNLKPHVHFRVCGDAGWMDRIQTIFLDSDKIEGFENCDLNKKLKKSNPDSSANLF